MATLSDFERTDLLNDHVAADINKLIATSLRAQHTNTETISATKELSDNDLPYQVITPSGATRTVELAPASTANHPTVIYNASGSQNITVKDSTGATTYLTMTPGTYAVFYPISGVDWKLVVYSASSGEVSGQFVVSGDISPSQITSNQNNYNPTGLSTAAVLRLNTNASRNITGLAGGADGRMIMIHNIGSNPIVLKDEDAASTAANRFALSADVTLSADQSVILQYDSTSSRWRLLGVTSAPDASVVTYTPAVSADWASGSDPGNADGALDQLAQRVTDLEVRGTAYKTSDESINTNTTLQNDDAIRFPMLANKHYHVVVLLRIEAANATMDGKIDWLLPASGVMSWGHHGAVGTVGSPAGAMGVINPASSIDPELTEASVLVFGTVAGISLIRLECNIRNGANAGEAILRWAQNTSNGSNLTSKAGSLLEWTLMN